MSLTEGTSVFHLSTALTTIQIYISTTSVSAITHFISSAPNSHIITASPLESFALGAGHPTEVPHWVKSFPMPTRMSHRILRNEGGAVVWKPDGPTAGKCIWAEHGVWGWDPAKGQAVALRENYFTRHPETGKEVCFFTRHFS